MPVLYAGTISRMKTAKPGPLFYRELKLWQSKKSYDFLQKSL